MGDIARVLITRDEIKKRVAEIADKISSDYKGEEILAVCVLRGASIFFADLVRELKCKTKIDFISVSSYGAGTTSSGEVKIVKDLNETLDGKNLLIVEDIVDTGITLNYLKNLLAARNPKTIKICTLLDKPDRRVRPLQPEYCCFSIPNEFVIGYGLDYKEEYRTLKDVCILDPSVYSKK